MTVDTTTDLVVIYWDEDNGNSLIAEGHADLTDFAAACWAHEAFPHDQPPTWGPQHIYGVPDPVAADWNGTAEWWWFQLNPTHPRAHPTALKRYTVWDLDSPVADDLVDLGEDDDLIDEDDYT